MSEATARRSAAELLRAYYHALDEPDLDRLDGLFAVDVDWRFPGQRLTNAAAVKRAMVRSLSTGLRMAHRIETMLEAGEVAICELVATNVVGGQSYLVRGAVVCEARDGMITRLTAYPDAAEMTAFLAGLEKVHTLMRGG